MKDGRVILPSYERDGASVTNQTARQPCEGMDMTNCVWNEMLTVGDDACQGMRMITATSMEGKVLPV